MSSPAQQSALEAAKLPNPSRTRLVPTGGNGRSVLVAGVLLVFCVLGALWAGSYSKGGSMSIQTNVANARILVDGTVAGTTSAAGTAELSGFPFGSRGVEIAAMDYRPYTTLVPLTWPVGGHLKADLQPIPLTLVVRTNPGAEVRLNGQVAGSANQEGVFAKQDVLPGDYTIEVNFAGFTPAMRKQHLSPPQETIYAYLSMSAERVRQVEEEQRKALENAERVRQLLGLSQQQFNARQYQQALSSVNQALALDAGNQMALQLRQRITETINILK